VHLHRGWKACRDLKALPNGTKLKKQRFFYAHIKPRVNEITVKISQAAEPKYYNNAFFWGQLHPALAAARPSRQHLLLWALLQTGQSCCFPSTSPKSCHAAPVQADAPSGPSEDLPLVQCWTGDGDSSHPGDAGEPF